MLPVKNSLLKSLLTKRLFLRQKKEACSSDFNGYLCAKFSVTSIIDFDAVWKWRSSQKTFWRLFRQNKSKRRVSFSCVNLKRTVFFSTNYLCHRLKFISTWALKIWEFVRRIFYQFFPNMLQIAGSNFETYNFCFRSLVCWFFKVNTRKLEFNQIMLVKLQQRFG